MIIKKLTVTITKMILITRISLLLGALYHRSPNNDKRGFMSAKLWDCWAPTVGPERSCPTGHGHGDENASLRGRYDAVDLNASCLSQHVST